MYQSSRLRWLLLLLRRVLCVFLFLVPVAFIVLGCVMVRFIGQNSYPAVLKWYAKWQPEGYDVHVIGARCFTPRVFGIVSGYQWVITGVLILGGIWYCLFGRRVWAFLQQLMEEGGAVIGGMAKVFRRMNGRQRTAALLLFMAIGVYRVYFYLVFPMYPDEVFSYLFFARQGVLVTLTNYILPNNHIALNLIGAVLDKTGGLSPRAVMRLPSLMGDLLLFSGIFCLFMRWDGFKRAFTVVGGVAFCYYTSYFATQGRGYELQIVCALVSGLSGWTCFCGPTRHLRKGYALFIFFSVIGLYLNPTFLYHIMAMALMCGYCLLKRGEGGWAVLVRAFVAIGLLALLFYLPILLGGGWGGLVISDLGKSKSFSELVHTFRVVPFMIKDISYYGMVGFLFVCLFFVYGIYLYWTGKLRREFYDASLAYLLSLAGSLLLWTLINRIYPYERTLCFAILGLYVLFVNVCYDWALLYLGRVTPWMIGCFLLVRISGSVRGMFWSRYSPESRFEVIDHRMIEDDLRALDGLHPSSWHIWNSDDYYAMYLKLYLIDHDRKDRVILKRDGAEGDVIFLPAWARDGYSPKGYRLWKVRALLDGNFGYTDSTYIYVTDRPGFSHTGF